MSAPDYAAMPRAELIRRIEAARESAHRILADNRALAERVTDLEGQVKALQSDIERAGEVVANLLDQLQLMDGEEIDSFSLAEGWRDELSAVLDLPTSWADEEAQRPRWVLPPKAGAGSSGPSGFLGGGG